MTACHARYFTWKRGCSSNFPPLMYGDQISHPLEDSDNQIPFSPGRQRCQMLGEFPGDVEASIWLIYNAGQRRHCFRVWKHVIQVRESTSRVHVCESRADPVFNQSSGGSFPSYAISVAFACWNFFLHAAKKNNNAAKFFLSLMQNNSEGFIGALWIL